MSEALESRCLLAASLVYGGAQTLVPGATINVSGDIANAQSEMSVVVNPTNPLNLVGFGHRVSTPIVLDVYSSSNGGATWSVSQINNADDGFGAAGNRFDPAVAFDANGTCYIVYGHREPGTPNRTRLIGARSIDGGVNFGNFRTIDIQNDRGTSPAVDKWYIHCGLDPASGGQACYVSWVHFAVEGPGGTVNDDRIMLAGTRDGGSTWTAPLLLNDPAATGAETGPTYACPVVGRNGELAVSWHDMNDDTIMLDRDLDGLWAGPSTFGTDITVRTGITVERDTMIPPAQPERGVNAAPMLEVWNNFNWLLMPVVERFGTGNDLDIWVGISTNFGETWSFQRVEGAVSTDFNPWLQVDQRTGAFHVLYLSTDGDPSGNDDVRPKIASSFNAGQTWQRGFLSAQTSNEAGGYAGDYLEYHGLAARDGTVHGLWPSRYAGGGQDLDAFTANAAYVSTVGDNRLVIGETGGPDDDYLVRLAPNNPAFLEVFVDGVREFTGLRQSVNSIIFNPGGGTNRFSIGTIPGLSALTINGTNSADTINIAALGENMPTLNMVLAGDADIVTLGTGPTDFLTIKSPINISGGAGSDRLNVGSGFAQAVAANVSFDGGPDGFDTVYVYDTNNTAAAAFDVTGAGITYHGFAPPFTVSYSNVDQIEMHGGSGADVFTVRSSAVVPIVRAFGNGGNDSFTAGDGGAVSGVRTFDGGAGTGDLMTIDVHNDPTARTYNITPTSVDPPGFTANTPNVERVAVLAGTGNDTIVFAAGTYAQEITFDAGAGSDQVVVNGARMALLTIRGGADSANDSLDIDDRLLPGNVIGGQVYADRIDREMFPTQTSQVFYSGFSNVNWYQQPNQNVITVYGTSSDIGANFQFSVIGNSLDDLLDVYTRDAQGNPTITGNLRFNGGGGPDWVSIFSGTAASNYRLHDPFGGSTAYLDGWGGGWIAVNAEVENYRIFGSPLNDSFAVEQFRQGGALSLFGGDGNDTCTIGNGDMSANLTNAAAFTFDGQNGSDRFTINNGVTNVPWTYQALDGVLQSSRSGYAWHTTLLSVESQYVFAGSAADTFNIDSTAAGVYTEFNGFAGLDALRVGATGARVDGIRGPIAYNAGADGGTVQVSNTGGFPATVHQDANTIGAYVGDNLFGSGGSLTFSGVTNSGPTQGVILGLASNSNVYAQPLAGAQVFVISGFLFQAPSGFVRLATAAAQNPVINGTAESGSLTSSNRQTLSWTNFTGAIQTDAVAPAVAAADINLNGVPGPGDVVVRRQSLDVRFSEDVSGRLSPSWLQLTNTTTMQPVPASNIAVDYDAATHTAHFTFPGYPLGILPDGDYSGKILAGLPDFFGNGLPAEAPFTFFFLQGDANHDGHVNLADFNILAANFGQPNRTFSQGDFDYDGTVNLSDFNLLASRFGRALGPDSSIERRAEFGTIPIRPSPKLRDRDLAELLAQLV